MPRLGPDIGRESRSRKGRPAQSDFRYPARNSSSESYIRQAARALPSHSAMRRPADFMARASSMSSSTLSRTAAWPPIAQ